MPNRWIKEAYCSSERIQSVKAEARDLWVRLLVNADDHGLFDARPQIVASRCYPLDPNAKKCEQLLAELEGADLIRRYEAEGKPYLMICRWYERARSQAKYPMPPDGLQTVASNCAQLKTVVDLHVHDHDHDHDHGTSAATRKIELSAEGEWQHISAKQKELWQRAYPALSLDAELAAAAAWILANPSNRKSNYGRFITNWLKRGQDNAPRVNGKRAVAADGWVTK